MLIIRQVRVLQAGPKTSLTKYKILFTIINLGVLTLVYNEEINFSSEGHSKSILNIPFIDILKKTACASKQDVLVHVTLQQ